MLESVASTIRDAKGDVAKLVIVNRDITEPAKVLEGVAEIRRVVAESVVPVFTTDATVQARCRGVGVRGSS